MQVTSITVKQNKDPRLLVWTYEPFTGFRNDQPFRVQLGASGRNYFATPMAAAKWMAELAIADDGFINPPKCMVDAVVTGWRRILESLEPST